MGTTAVVSNTSACSVSLARAKAMAYAPEPPPTSSIRLTPSVPSARTTWAARSRALRSIAAMNARVLAVDRRAPAHAFSEIGPATPQVRDVHQAGARVVRRSRREVPGASGRVLKDLVAFGEEVQRNQRVQQPFGGPRVGVQLRRGLSSRAALPDRGEHVELEGGEDGAALLKGLYRLGQILRHGAAGVPGAQAGHYFLAVGADLRRNRRLVHVGESPHQPPFLQMAAHDFRNVPGLGARIPDALGIDDHVRPTPAQIETAADRDLDLVHEAASGDLPAQRFKHLAGPARRAGGRAFGLLLIANIDVITKSFHNMPPLFRICVYI